MPTRNISLTPEQDAFVEGVVKAGDYQNASEAIRDALRLLQQCRREDELKLEALRMQLKAGVDALEPGDFVEVDDADLEDHLERLTTPKESEGVLIRWRAFVSPASLRKTSRAPTTVTSRPAIFDRQVAALDITGLAQTLTGCCQVASHRVRQLRMQVFDHRQRGLLPPRRQRPRRCRAAE